MSKEFTDVIYVNRKQLKNLQLLKLAYCWPNYVWVMDSTYKLNGTYYDPIADTPGTMYGWAEYMFRSIPPQTCPVKDIVHCLRIWWGIHEQILSHFTNLQQPTPTPITVFNTVWALLGYVHNQDREAIDLAIALMSSPVFHENAVAKSLPPLDISNGKEKTHPTPRTKPKAKRSATAPSRRTPPKRNARNG